MSGAAEGIAGLALSAVSVAALFTTCIQCFDIVVAGKNFSEDYEQLFAIFAIQRTRFGLWGESVGLIPNPNDGRCLPYNERIDRKDIRPGIENILNNIKLLLQEADKVDERYGLKIVVEGSSGFSASVGFNIFKDSFERFKGRIKKNQKQKSAWKVTKWAIHDATKFETLINRLEKYVDGLEKLTDSLERLEQRLRKEIDSISDVQSLRLLCDASSSYRGSNKNDVSDTASRRINVISEAGFETQTLATASVTYDTRTTFITAESRPSGQIGRLSSLNLPVPGAWPRSVRSESSQQVRKTFPSTQRAGIISKANRSCAECLEEYYKCEPHITMLSCSRCYNKRKNCSFDRELTEENDPIVHGATTSIGGAQNSVTDDQDYYLLQQVPQNQRLVRELVKNGKLPNTLSFEAGDAHYGEKLEAIKAADIGVMLENSARFLHQANNGSSAAKRMFLELRNIRMGNVPFVSAAPIGDSIDKVLASIEGPPETPYEGGVFWISVRLSDKDVIGPPLIRFHTKIYHPNISPQGHICADYKEKWSSVFNAGPHSTVRNPNAMWYHGKSQVIHWSLGALLTALCGLLASPDVEDPLVPEIAHKYLTDYAGYCEAARLYTKLYATRDRPNENDVIFLDDEMSSTKYEGQASSPLTIQEPDIDTISIQRSLRETYDEHFPRDSSFGLPINKNSDDKVIGELSASEAAEKAKKLFKDSISHMAILDEILLVPADKNMIEKFWKKVERQWDFKNWWCPTRIEIGCGLLKAIKSHMKFRPDGTRIRYIEYEKAINSFFAELAVHAQNVYVSETSADRIIAVREFTIAVETRSGQSWVALARMERLITLGTVLQICLRSSVRRSKSHDAFKDLEELTDSASIETIAKFLGLVLKLPRAELLATSQFTELMQPAMHRLNDFVLEKYEPGQQRIFTHYRESNWTVCQ